MFFKTTNLEPDNFAEAFKSISLFILPISVCDLGLKENFLIFPTCSINLFDFSSFPIGTSSTAKFGILEIKALINAVYECDFYTIGTP